MRVRLIVCGALAFTASACDPLICGGRLADACQKAQDLGYVTGVQLADAASSGNATIGKSGALFARGKMDISVRATGVPTNRVRFDDVRLRTDGVAAATGFGVDEATVRSLSVDAATGVWRGWRRGQTRIGGLDLLLGVSVTPDGNVGGLRQTSGGRHAVAFGLRLGLLDETRTLPAVSLSGAYRGHALFSATTPPLSADSGGTVTIKLHDADITGTTLRLAASKQLSRFGVTAGVGRDHYALKSDYSVIGSNDLLGSGEGRVSLELSRRVAFAGASFTLGRTALAAELGRAFPGRAPQLMNTFGERTPNAARSYATFGVRIAAGRTHDPK